MIVPNHIVLYQPEVPANTGNIARTCAATDTHLHLIRPLGISTDDKMLKCADLDYWQYVNITYHDSMDDFFLVYPNGEFFYLTKFDTPHHTTFYYSHFGKDYFFMFRRLTAGLPKELITKNKDRCLRITSNENVHSLNLS